MSKNTYGRDHASEKGAKSDGVAHEPESEDYYKEGYCVIEHADFPGNALCDTLLNKGKAPTFQERESFQNTNRLTSDADGMSGGKHDA